MRWIVALLASSWLSIAYSNTIDAPEVVECAPIQASLTKGETLMVYEGLPHQTFEKELLEKELKRQDVKKISSFGFYTPATKVESPEKLKKLLSSASSLIKFRGEKRCGGFHPDFAVSWTTDDVTRHALICFNCEEVMFLEAEKTLRYDLSPDVKKKLSELLDGYAAKRPKK
jgi:hypothetical protein